MKLDFKDKAQPKIGSKDYIDHKPGGGAKKVRAYEENHWRHINCTFGHVTIHYSDA